MPPPSEVRTTFTVDLTPFAAGLKSALMMTQATGKQITPLLNMQVKAPNFAPIDAQLKQLTKTTDDYIAAQVASIAPVQNVENKTKSVTAAHGAHETSLRGVHREARQSLGAILFLGGSIMQLTGFSKQAEIGQKNLAKSLTEGLGAGLGFAGMLSIIPGVGIPAALAVGSIVSIGVGLLDFFDKGPEKAKRMQMALEAFGRGLSGASIAQLTENRQRILADLSAIEKKVKDSDATIRGLKSQLSAFPATGDREAGGLSPEELHQRAELQKKVKDAQQGKDQLTAVKERETKELAELDKKMEGQMLTHADAVRAAQTLIVKAVLGGFEQRRAQANVDLKQQLEENQKITAGTKERIDADKAANQIHSNELKKIADDELKAKDDHRKKMLDVDKEIALMSIDTDEKKAMSTAKTELDKIAITERFALKRLAIEQEYSKQSLLIEKARLEKLNGPDEKRRIAEIDEELAKLAARSEAAAEKIRNESSSAVMAIPGMPPVGTIARQLQIIKDLEDEFDKETVAGRRQAIQQLINLENHKLDVMSMSGQELLQKERQVQEELLQKERQVQEERRQMWRETHEIQVALIDGLTAGIRSGLNQVLMIHRQAKNVWDGIWISMFNTVVSAFTEIGLAKLANFLIDQALLAASTATTIASMEAIAAVAETAAYAVSVATFGAAALSGTAALVAGLSIYKGASKASRVAGFAEGGKTKRGEAGFIEGFRPEIIAPEEDFYKVARTEIIPRMLIEQSRQLDVKFAQRMSEKMQASGGSSNLEVLRALGEVKDAIKGLRVEQEFDGLHLKTVLRNQNEKDKRIGRKS